MFDVILFVVFFYFLLQGIFVFVRIKKNNEVREEIGDLIAKAQEELKKVLVVRVEKHGEMFYLYNQTSNEFICQGKDLQEVRKAYLLRYPNKRALVDDGKDLLFKEKSHV
jgi:hypothetical protein